MGEQASAVSSMKSEEQEAMLAAMSPKEQAAVLGAMSSEKRAMAFAAIGSEKQGAVLATMSIAMREASLQAIPVFRREKALESMEEALATQPKELLNESQTEGDAEGDAEGDDQAVGGLMFSPNLGMKQDNNEPSQTSETEQQENPLWGQNADCEDEEDLPLTPKSNNPVLLPAPACSEACGPCCKCGDCCTDCLRSTFESLKDGELKEDMRVYAKETAAAAGALRCLLERIPHRKRAQLLVTMTPQDHAASLAALGPEETATHLCSMLLEEQAVILAKMTPDERIEALNRMKNEDERNELLSWRICAGCVLSGLSFVYALFCITAGVAHTPRLIDNTRGDTTDVYAGFFMSALAVASLYIFWCTLWPLLTAARREHDPQGQAPLAACQNILLILGIICQGVWRRWEPEWRPESAVVSVLACAEGIFALVDFLCRRKAAPARDCGLTHNGWRMAVVLCSVFGHMCGIGLVFCVYYKGPETLCIGLFMSYMFFTCASGYAIYFIYFVAEMRTYLHNREHTLYQNFWRCTIHYNLRERFVSLVWVVAVTLCLMTISTRLYSVIAIGVLAVLGWMYQYIHHCHEYRSRLSRVTELEWVHYPESDDEEQVEAGTELRSLMPSPSSTPTTTNVAA